MMYNILRQLEQEAKNRGCTHMLVLRNKDFDDNFVIGVKEHEDLDEKKAYYKQRNELVDVIDLSDEEL